VRLVVLTVVAFVAACAHPHPPAPPPALFCADITTQSHQHATSACGRGVATCQLAAMKWVAWQEAHARHFEVGECAPAAAEWCTTIDGAEQCFASADDCAHEARDASPCR
jgi:hypothetical protein